MVRQYTKDELWKLYENLPPEIKEAIFSSENAEQIFAICERNEVEEMQKVAYVTGLVLFGLLRPEDLEMTFKTELNISEDAAKAVGKEINRFIIDPLRSALTNTQSRSINPVISQKENSTSQEPMETIATTPSLVAPKSVSSDRYRETVE